MNVMSEWAVLMCTSWGDVEEKGYLLYVQPDLFNDWGKGFGHLIPFRDFGLAIGW